MTTDETLYGLLAEFPGPNELINAATAARKRGYVAVEAYAPFPVDGLSEALALPTNIVPIITLIGGIFGAAAAYVLQWWINVVSYPANIGGKPFHSWPAFIPVTFELTVLGAALAAVLGMLILNGLPRPYHPVFRAKEFERASRDGFFLCLRSIDPKFSLPDATNFLKTLVPSNLIELRAD